MNTIEANREVLKGILLSRGRIDLINIKTNIEGGKYGSAINKAQKTHYLEMIKTKFNDFNTLDLLSQAWLEQIKAESN